MRSILITGMIIVSVSMPGCEEEGPNGGKDPGTSRNEWLIPKDQVFDGGPGKDGIPALTLPGFVPADEADHIQDNDLVLGFAEGGTSRAYPHSILDWHEIINDRVGEIHISVTYCPLTGTGIGWNREIGGKVTTFGVSGLLYNSNLIPYDRETDSNWSQIRLDCVNGELAGTGIETYNLVETTWATWKKMFPGTEAVSTKTGYSRNYGQYPYGSYRTNHDYILFPVANEDDRLPAKERVHGIVRNGTARIYPLSDFGERVSVIKDSFEGEEFLVVGNSADNFAVSFHLNSGNLPLSFSPLQDQYPLVMEDDQGNKWDVMGRAVSGPRTGDRLGHARSFIGYWFSFAAFYPGLTIHGE
jgi:hypothetical protein